MFGCWSGIWLELLLLFSFRGRDCGADPDVWMSPNVREAGDGRMVSLQSGQFLITRLTVSLIRTQWYFSAIVAVVLLMPPCCDAWT